MKSIYVYSNSNIIGKNINGTFKEISESNKKYKYITLDSLELSDVNTYEDTTKLNFDGSEKRYLFEAGYFPILNILESNTNQTYWGESYLNITQDKISVPVEDSIENESNQSTFSLLPRPVSEQVELPELYAYSVDVDKLNLEFSYTDPYTFFEVKSNDDTIIDRTSIKERVYTLEYDYNTPLQINISNLQNWYTQTVIPTDVRNLLDIVNEEDIYLSDNKLYSNKREIAGEYVNIYKGKALTTNGDIYQISNMKNIDKLENKIKLLDKQTAISQYKFEDKDIQTYYHCSKVIQNDESVYKDQQIFIKNNNIYLIDGQMNTIGNAVIIDSYNNNQYETTLGTDGVLYDLLTEIKYPMNFKNKDIISITNNIDNNSNIILVYYSNGKVIGFNYITGEQVYDNNINNNENLISYMINSLNFEEELYEFDKSNYDEAKDLSETLEKVSIEQALEDIKNDGENKKLTIQSEQQDENQYVTTYNPSTQSYVVYSSSELFKANITHIESENEKINNNSELISYYTSLSKSKMRLNSVGMIIFIVTISSICIILLIMYKKNNKQNR